MGFDSEVDCCRTINLKGYSSSFHTEDNMEYDSSLYEIIIGGYNNKKSIIRRKNLNIVYGDIQKEASTPEIVNAHRSRGCVTRIT